MQDRITNSKKPLATHGRTIQLGQIAPSAEARVPVRFRTVTGHRAKGEGPNWGPLRSFMRANTNGKESLAFLGAGPRRGGGHGSGAGVEERRV